MLCSQPANYLPNGWFDVVRKRAKREREKERASILNRLTDRDRPNSHVTGQKKLFLFFNLKLIVVSNTILGRGEAIWFI